jgi:hypothetical protein
MQTPRTWADLQIMESAEPTAKKPANMRAWVAGSIFLLLVIGVAAWASKSTLDSGTKSASGTTDTTSVTADHLGPVGTDPNTTLFVADGRYHLPGADNATLLAIGHNICTAIEQVHGDPYAMRSGVVAVVEYQGVPANQVGTFMGLSAAAFCPQYTTQVAAATS